MIFYFFFGIFFALICTSNFKLLLLLVQVRTGKCIVTIVEINQEQFQANSVSEENCHLRNIQVKMIFSESVRERLTYCIIQYKLYSYQTQMDS